MMESYSLVEEIGRTIDEASLSNTFSNAVTERETEKKSIASQVHASQLWEIGEQTEFGDHGGK